jgi:tetratricopeptide (TPR) repeat protein
VLTVASAVGRRFEMRLLARVVEGLSEGMLLEALEEALSARVIEELPRVAGRYQFTHGLIHETLYEELTTTRRVRLHAQIAVALEALYGTTAETHAAELAHHFGEAEALLGTEKLVKYSLLAGERALASCAYEEALAHFQRGLAAKDGKPMDMETAGLLFGLGHAEAALLMIDEAAGHLGRAFDFYAQAGDVQRGVAVASLQFTGWRGAELMAPVRERALKIVPPESIEAGRLLCAHARYVGLQGRGDYEGSRELCQRALAIARRESDKHLELRTLSIWGNNAALHLREQEVKQTVLQALPLLQSVDSPWDESGVRNMAVYMLMEEGDFKEAKVQGAMSLTAAERLRDRERLSSVCCINQQLTETLGDWAAATAFCDRALASWPHDSRVLFHRTLQECELGNFDQAEVYLERLLELVRRPELGAPWPDALAALVVPLVARITGDAQRMDIAKAAAKGILSTPRQMLASRHRAMMGMALMATEEHDVQTAKDQYAMLETMPRAFPLVYGVCTPRILGVVAQGAGTLDKAMAHFEEALVVCRKAGARPELAWTCCDYADTLLKRNGPGDHARAMKLLDESLAISRELGMKPLMERVLSRRKLLKA